MASIHTADSGDLFISAGATLSEIANNDSVQRSYPLLADACAHDDAKVGATSLAESITAPSKCIHTSDGVACALSGTSICAAKDPSSRHHAIINGGLCWLAYTSLPGVALYALDAVIEYGDGDRNGVMQRARIPAHAAGGFQLLLQSRDQAPDVAIISLAAVRRVDGDVRLVLGGVAPRPYRVYTSVEEEAMAGGLDEDTIAGLAERALLDADSGAGSANKVDAAAALLRRAIEEIDGNSR